ncbi:phosphonate utilization transcriptional regulator PhnR [Photobacterium leiognathi]|uniref:phosphonate utilization transcriptional regulator PhnR n=1 Tax=Photobacterium leiognathi TaxID=553611 RepID=UPI00273A4851|nr:phosphonate utilization transcriptional regulator PhnR [Photobacterium leiognathi]
MQYLKIKEAIYEQIESGQLGDKLPSERKLAESFNTTRITLREALSLLESEGKLFREDRRGWFISPQPLIYDPTNTTEFPAMAMAQGRTPRSELLSAELVKPNKQVAQLLHTTTEDELYRIKRLRYLDNRPVVVVTNYILQSFFPNLLETDFTHSLSIVYREQFNRIYTKTRYRVSTTSLTGSTATALRATAGSPAMFVERLNYDQFDNLIDCDFEYWRHDAICIQSLATLKHL